MTTKCDDNTVSADSKLAEWTNLLVKAAADFGRPMDAQLNKSRLEAAGFVNVVEVQYKWPQNRWPKDPKLKEIGMSNFTFL